MPPAPRQAAEAELAGPTRPADRVALLDLLRGVAVLGILLANLPLIALSQAFGGAAAAAAEGADRAAYVLVRVLADTKLITLFSLLFGAGLALMQQRMPESAFPRIYLRRLAGLAVLGLLHALLLWWGDILFHYAIVGVVAFLLRDLAPRMLAGLGLAALALGFLPAVAVGLLLASASDSGEAAADAAALYSSGDALGMIAHRATLFLPLAFVTTIASGARTLGLFLLGMAAVKGDMLRRLHPPPRALRLLAIPGLVLGLAVQLLWLAAEGRAVGSDDLGRDFLSEALKYLAGLALVPAYVVLIALWDARAAAGALRRALAAVGRMALTSYLTHSLVTAVVFNYLGFYDRWGRAQLLIFCLVLFALQLVFSPWWLARFRHGPIEWIWRWTTYGTRPRLRRGA